MLSFHPRGFTLIELMIALVIASLLVGVAGPSFESAMTSSRVASAASELNAAVHLARNEAIRDNGRVVLCRSDDLSTCTAGAGAWKGWMVFVDSDGSGQREAGETLLRTGAIESPLLAFGSGKLVALDNRIAFRADGRARSSDGLTALSGTIAVCVTGSQAAENVRELSIAFGGRTTVSKKSSIGPCSAPTDA